MTNLFLDILPNQANLASPRVVKIRNSIKFTSSTLISRTVRMTFTYLYNLAFCSLTCARVHDIKRFYVCRELENNNFARREKIYASSPLSNAITATLFHLSHDYSVTTYTYKNMLFERALFKLLSYVSNVRVKHILTFVT